jgi:hypothetical protein
MSSPVPSPDLTLIATRIMSGLIGWRWTYPARRVVETYRVPYQTRTISLYGRPVSAVHSVAGPTGQILPTTDYQLNNGTQIWFLQPQDWWWPGGLYDVAAPPPWFNMSWYGTIQPPGTRDITVDYTYGSPPPLDIQRAINQLAQQFALAEACDWDNCKLPERVTSVTREGISYTLIDPQDFLENGRTGLYFVDLVIKTYVGTKARSRVSSPEIPPPRRISSTQVL